MLQKTKVVILGLIRNEDGRYLISQRFDPDVPEAHLKWDLVGGTNKFGESLKDTLKREILEETGLHVDILDMFPESFSRIWTHREFDMHTLVFCFNCKMISGDLHLRDEGINDLKWIHKHEFKDHEFLNTTKFFIEMLS